MNAAANWGNFFSATAAAAAALAGLIFVSISINLTKILTLVGVADRALEAMTLLLGVLLVSIVALAPGVPDRVLGAAIVAVEGVVWLIAVTLQLRQYRRRLQQPLWWLVNRVLLCQLAAVPFCIAGLSLLLGDAGAMAWTVPGTVFSFVGAANSAWVLLIEILR